MKETEDNIVAHKSFEFAIRIVNLFEFLIANYKIYKLAEQIVKSGTSIGANIKEAVRGQSAADFHAKMCIALKEASETEYWLELLSATGYLTESQSESMLRDCRELLRLLTSIVKTTRNGLKG